MKLAAILAQKDLLQTVRDKLSFIFILVMPLAFTLFFGLLFGAGSSVDQLPLAVWDADGGAAATQLVAALEESPVVRVVARQGNDFETWMADERAAAGLLIPEGYSAAVAAGERADLTLVSIQGSSGASTVASEVRTLAGKQVTVELASRAAAEAVWSTRSMPAGAQEEVVADAAAQARPIVAKALASPAVSTDVVEAGVAAGQIPSGFVLSSPGMMVNFILFSLLTAGIALIVERQNGTLQRLMTTRLRRWQLIGGKAAGMFLLTFVQQILLIAVAQIFFGVDYLRDPAALLVMMVALSLVASTLGSAARVRPEERAGAHRDHRPRLDEHLRPLRRLVPARGDGGGVPDGRAPAAHGLDPRRAARDRGARVRRRRRAARARRLGGVGGRLLRARGLALPPERVEIRRGRPVRSPPKAAATDTPAGSGEEIPPACGNGD